MFLSFFIFFKCSVRLSFILILSVHSVRLATYAWNQESKMYQKLLQLFRAKRLNKVSKVKRLEETVAGTTRQWMKKKQTKKYHEFRRMDLNFKHQSDCLKYGYKMRKIGSEQTDWKMSNIRKVKTSHRESHSEVKNNNLNKSHIICFAFIWNQQFIEMCQSTFKTHHRLDTCTKYMEISVATTNNWTTLFVPFVRIITSLKYKQNSTPQPTKKPTINSESKYTE